MTFCYYITLFVFNLVLNSLALVYSNFCYFSFEIVAVQDAGFKRTFAQIEKVVISWTIHSFTAVTLYCSVIKVTAEIDGDETSALMEKYTTIGTFEKNDSTISPQA